MNRHDLYLFLFFLAVLFPLVVETFQDYIVMGYFVELGHGGYPFWLCQYWWGSTALQFLSISILVGITYMLYRVESKRHKITAGIISLTVFWQYIAGNLDLLWFIIDAIRHGRPWINWGTVWVWSPFYWGFGIEWTTKHQMFTTFIMNFILVLIWIFYIFYLKYNKKQ